MKDLIDAFRRELKTAITSHYARITTEFDDIYGYSIYTTYGVQAVWPVCNRLSSLAQHIGSDHFDEYKYLAVEWYEWEDYGLFEEVNLIGKDLYEGYQNEFALRINKVLRSSLDVLIELERDGLFGARANDRLVAICWADTNDSIMEESVRLLNSNEVYTAYSKVGV